MGSRLRPVPERIFECLIEVTAPLSKNEDSKLVSFFPENYEDVGMLKDVVPKFCFPFAHDAEMVDAVQHFAFVLTDIEGLFRFGFCRYPPKAKTCLCILSDLPAFEMFYGILNTLAELENNAKNESITSKQFLDLVLDSRVPEPGTKFTVSDPGSGWVRHFNYPDPEKLPSIPANRNMTDYFSAVNPNNMIALFASMMFERRIIVTSKKLSLLTACTYSASLLLYPMHWQHVFIPVMPASLLDYCSAPMPFLVGVHSSLMEKVRDMPLDDVVILDIDKNEIELTGDCCYDVDELPPEAVTKLNSTLNKNTIAIGEYVARAFLSATVILIGGYRDALKLSSDTIIFERDLFLNSRPHMKSFLESLLKLQLFERFIHHRLQQLNSGEAIDDVFEEQVGLQTENDSKWVSQYKQWMKNRKRDGTQLLNNLSGKTEQATSRARKFIHAGVKNVKFRGKNGWKEAMKGIKKNFTESSKGTDKDVSSYDNEIHQETKRSNSLPMRKVYAVEQDPKAAARKSVGSALHNHINPPASSTESPPLPPRMPRETNSCPATPPPRLHKDISPKHPRRSPPPRPPNPPPRRPSTPPPYQASPPSDSNEVKPRPSMIRNPGDPGVKDLINFYDSQEDLTASSSSTSCKADPFRNFKEFDYLANQKTQALSGDSKTQMNGLSKSDENLTASSPSTSCKADSFRDFKEFDYLANKKTQALSGDSETQLNGLSKSDQNLNESEGLFDQTMIALSDDTRKFLRDSRIRMESSQNAKTFRNSNRSVNNSPCASPRFQQKPSIQRSPAGKKTLMELALEQKTGNENVPSLAHASSAPSLFDQFAGNTENELRDSNSKSSLNINSDCMNNTNFDLLAQVGFEEPRTDNGDPFLQLISQRHKPQRNVAPWAAEFE